MPLLLLLALMAAVSAVDAQTLTPGAFPATLYLGAVHSVSIVASAPAATPGLVVYLDCGSSVVVTPAVRCLAAGGTVHFTLQTTSTAVASTPGDACVYFVDSEYSFVGSASSGPIPRAERGPLDIFPESSVDQPITAYIYTGLNPPVAVVRLTPQDAPTSTVTPSVTCSDLANLHGQIRPGSAPYWVAGDNAKIEVNIATAVSPGFDGVDSYIRCVWTLTGDDALRYLPIADSYFKLTRPEVLTVGGIPWSSSLVAPGTSVTIQMGMPSSLPSASAFVLFTLSCTSNGANAVNVLSFRWQFDSAGTKTASFPVVDPTTADLSVLHECRWVVTGNDDQASKYTVAQPSFRFVVGNGKTIRAPANVQITSASQALTITATTGSLREATNVLVVCTGETPDAGKNTTAHVVALSPGSSSGSFNYVRAAFFGDPATPVQHRCSLQMDPASSDAPHFSVDPEAHIFMWGDLPAFPVWVFPVAAVPLVFDIRGLHFADSIVERIASPLPPSTAQSIAVVAPVSLGESTYAASFTLGLSCTYGALNTVLVSSTLSWDTPSTPSIAQSVPFITPAIPGVGEGVEVSCTWTLGGTVSEAAKYAQPSAFSFWVGTTVQLVASVPNPGAPIPVDSMVALSIFASSDATPAAPTNLWLRCGSCGDSGMVSFSGPVVLDRPGGVGTSLNSAALTLTTTRVGRVNCTFSFTPAAAGEDTRHFLLPAPLTLTVGARFRPTPKGLPTASDSIVTPSIDVPVAVSTVYTISIARPQFQIESGRTLTYQLSCSVGSPILSNGGLITFNHANTAPTGQPSSQSFTLTTTSTAGALYRCSWAVGGDLLEQARSTTLLTSSFEFQAEAASPLSAHVLTQTAPVSAVLAGAWSDPVTLSTSANVVVGAQGLTLRVQCTGVDTTLEVRSGSSATPYAALVSDGAAGFFINVAAGTTVGPSTPLSYVFRAPPPLYVVMHGVSLFPLPTATCSVEIMRDKLVTEQGAQWRLWSISAPSASISTTLSLYTNTITVTGDAISGPLAAPGLTTITASVDPLSLGISLTLSLACSNLAVSPSGLQSLTSSLVFSITVPALQAGDTGNSYECEFAFDTSDASNMAWSKFTLSPSSFTVRLGQAATLSFETPLSFDPSTQYVTTVGGTNDEFVMVSSGCLANVAITATCYGALSPEPLAGAIVFSNSGSSTATFAATDIDIRFRFLAPLLPVRAGVGCIFHVQSTDSRSSFVFGFGAAGVSKFGISWRVESAKSAVGIDLYPVRPSGDVSVFSVGLTANPLGGVTLALSCTDLVVSPSRLFFPQNDATGYSYPQSVVISAIDSNYHESYCNFSVVSDTPLPSGGIAQFGEGLLNVKLVTGRIGGFDSTLTTVSPLPGENACSNTQFFTLTPSYTPQVDVQLQVECTSTGLSSASGQGVPLASINGESLLIFTFPKGSAASRELHVRPLGASNVKAICLFTSLTPGWVAPHTWPISFGTPIPLEVSGVPAGLRYGTTSTPISITPGAVVPGDSAVNTGGSYTVFSASRAHAQHTFSAGPHARALDRSPSPSSRHLLTAFQVSLTAELVATSPSVADYLSVPGLVLLISCNVGTPQPSLLHFAEGSQAALSFTVTAPSTSNADVQIICGFASSGTQGFAFGELASVEMRSSMERALVFGGSLTSTMQLGSTASLSVQPPQEVLLPYEVALACVPEAVSVSPSSVSFGVGAQAAQEFTLTAGFIAGATNCSWTVTGAGASIITRPVTRSVVVTGTLPPSSSTAVFECGATCAAGRQAALSRWTMLASIIVGVAASLLS